MFKYNESFHFVLGALLTVVVSSLFDFVVCASSIVKFGQLSATFSVSKILLWSLT